MMMEFVFQTPKEQMDNGEILLLTTVTEFVDQYVPLPGHDVLQ
jgi:hypothetical protein